MTYKARERPQIRALDNVLHPMYLILEVLLLSRLVFLFFFFIIPFLTGSQKLINFYPHLTPKSAFLCKLLAGFSVLFHLTPLHYVPSLGCGRKL